MNWQELTASFIVTVVWGVLRYEWHLYVNHKLKMQDLSLQEKMVEELHGIREALENRG